MILTKKFRNFEIFLKIYPVSEKDLFFRSIVQNGDDGFPAARASRPFEVGWTDLDAWIGDEHRRANCSGHQDQKEQRGTVFQIIPARFIPTFYHRKVDAAFFSYKLSYTRLFYCLSFKIGPDVRLFHRNCGVAAYFCGTVGEKLD